ncbi:hypothetical protein Taro_055097, partial [Colocasia esculenta]|nr:hypothetical protein [Colocasia esculenta]
RSAPSWGRGTGRRGPTRGVIERRLPDGQQWNVSLHFNGKSLDDAIVSVPAGVDSSDWQTMCEMWTTGDEREVMTQMIAPSSDVDAESHTTATPEDAFISVMGKD